MSCIFVYIYGNPITEKQTATSYSMVWKETSKNGGTVNGTWGGPMIDGKRDGLWKADVKFNLFGDGPNYRTGSITMTRSYKKGIPDGPYKYNYNVNYREGYYNSRAGKWVYTEPEGDTESVSGSFVNGRPDGRWSIKSTMRGGFESEMNFDKGIPKGEIRSYEYFWGPRVDVFDEKGFLIQHEENGNHGINGWKYSNPDSIPLDVRVRIPASRYFTSDGVDDNYYAKGCEMFKWIQIYPYMSSEDTPILEGKEVHHKNYDEREDIKFKEFYGGDPDWIALKEKAKNNIMKNIIFDKVKDKANQLSDIWYEIKNKDEKYTDFRTRTNSMIYELEIFKEIINNDNEISEITSDPNYDLIEKSALNEYFKMVSDENLMLERLKYHTFIQNGREDAKKMIGQLSEDIPQECIDSLFIPKINTGSGYYYILSRKNKNIYFLDTKSLQENRERNLRIDGPPPIEPTAWSTYLHNYYTTNYVPIKNFDDITEEDLLIYFIFNEMNIESEKSKISNLNIPFNSSMLNDSPRYKISQLKNREKDPHQLLNKINEIRKVIPRDINLSKVKYCGGIINRTKDLENTYSVEELKENMKNSGLWKKLMKNYNKILNRK